MRTRECDRIEGHSTPEPNTGCWLWTSVLNSRGYGMVWFRGRTRLAHRVSKWLTDGRDPGDAVVLHSCDTPACVNPAHLSLGTQSQNIRECCAKRRHAHSRRTMCPSGHPLDGLRYDGVRFCRACKRKVDQIAYLRRKEVTP